MATKKVVKKQVSKVDKGAFLLIFCALIFCFVVVLVEVVYQVFNPKYSPVFTPDIFSHDSNEDVEQYVTEFFTNNGAQEMIRIIGCESEFQQFAADGEVLKNRQGSSAVGVAQIMESVHPDPAVIHAYNRQNNAQLSVDSFDINTIAGNVGYAYVLYKTRGTKDWECAKKI